MPWLKDQRSRDFGNSRRLRPCWLSAPRGHGGFSGLSVGSVGIHLATHAAGKVVVVRPPLSTVDSRPVVVGVSASQGWRPVGTAFEEAAARGVGLVLVRGAGEAATPDGLAAASALVRQSVDEWGPRLPAVAVATRVLPVSAAHALVLASREAQLLVLGARGSGGFEGLLLGGTSQQLLHQGLCTEMIVR